MERLSHKKVSTNLLTFLSIEFLTFRCPHRRTLKRSNSVCGSRLLRIILNVLMWVKEPFWKAPSRSPVYVYDANRNQYSASFLTYDLWQKSLPRANPLRRDCEINKLMQSPECENSYKCPIDENCVGKGRSLARAIALSNDGLSVLLQSRQFSSSD